MLDQRLLEIGIAYRDVRVPSEQVRTALESCQTAIVSGRLRKESAFSASDAEPNQIREWLSARAQPELQVWILWAHDRAGAVLRYGLFVENFDSLWYPSADDLWIVDGPSPSFLLELNHEEQFSYYR